MVVSKTYYYHGSLPSSELFFSSGSGELEFEEFVELAAKFLVEEDEEALRAELREAFRIYDKGGKFCQYPDEFG